MPVSVENPEGDPEEDPEENPEGNPDEEPEEGPEGDPEEDPEEDSEGGGELNPCCLSSLFDDCIDGFNILTSLSGSYYFNDHVVWQADNRRSLVSDLS